MYRFPVSEDPVSDTVRLLCINGYARSTCLQDYRHSGFLPTPVETSTSFGFADGYLAARNLESDHQAIGTLTLLREEDRERAMALSPTTATCDPVPSSMARSRGESSSESVELWGCCSTMGKWALVCH